MMQLKQIILYLFSLLFYCQNIVAKNFILISAPGSGKGTFSQYMAKKYDYVHIGCGDIYREKIDNHESISSFTLTQILREYILKSLKNNKNFILDNAINSKESWISWKYFFKINNLTEKICFVILETSDETCLERIKDRLVCKKCFNVCKKTKNTRFETETCNECGGYLTTRKEDHDAKFLKKRFKNYHKKMNAIMSEIEKSYQVIKISSEQPISKLYDLYDQLHNL